MNVEHEMDGRPGAESSVAGQISGRHRFRSVGAAVLLATALAGAAAGCGDSASDAGDPTVGSSTTSSSPGGATETTLERLGQGIVVEGWEQMPAWPLTERSQAATAWTGDELLFIGGFNDRCPPNADCTGPSTIERDGAALNPETRIWRKLAAAPYGISWEPVAYLDGAVYVLKAGAAAEDPSPDGPAEATILRYDLAEDSWSTLPSPVSDTSWYSLVVAGDQLVLSPSSDERGVLPVLISDPAVETWEELPDDPLPNLFDRTLAWDDGQLYLFGQELVANPGSEKPSLSIAARLDLEAGEWERLPDSEVLWSSFWAAGDGIFVNPSLGEADGGEVNNWGRLYPEGGIFNSNDETWHRLPPASPGDRGSSVGGFVGSEHSGFSGTGLVLDVEAAEWIEMRSSPGGAEQKVVTAGRDAVAFGGVDWSGDEPETLSQIWLWRPPA